MSDEKKKKNKRPETEAASEAKPEKDTESQATPVPDWEAKAHEHLDGWKRTQADFENYKKREEMRRKDTIAYVTERVVDDLVPVLDNLQSMTEHIPEASRGEGWVIGLTHIERQFEEALVKNGVTPLEVKEGDVFDPSKHEAISKEEKKDDKESKGETVEKVLRKGYALGGRVIRPARVVIT